MKPPTVEILTPALLEEASAELQAAASEAREKLAKRYAGTGMEPELFLGRMYLPGRTLEVLMGPINGPDHRAVMGLIVKEDTRAQAPQKILGSTVLWFTGMPADAPSAPGALTKLVNAVGGTMAQATWDLAWAYQGAIGAGGGDDEGKG